MQNSEKEETDDSVSELTFGILSDDVNSDVNTDVNLSSLSNIAETSVNIEGSQVGSETGAEVTDGIGADSESDGLNTTTSLGQANLLPENLVLVETSKGLVGYVSTGVIDDQGRPLYTSTVPVALFSNSQPGSIVDGQDGGLFGSSPDGITVTTTPSLFDDGSTNSQTMPGLNVPVQIISNDIMAQAGNEKVSLSPEKRKKGGGWPKGKKRKAVPEFQAPKKPATGYVLFAVKRRRQIKMTNPDLSFSEVTKILGQEWTSLQEDTKNRYLQLAEKDKKRYIREMKQFQNSDYYQNYLKKKKSDSGDQELIDLEDNEAEDELQCKICNQFFISAHNKKEHMFGRQHIMAITKQIQALADLQKQQVATAASLDNQALTSVNKGSSSIPLKPPDVKPVDVEGFIKEFMRKNQERDSEIEELLKSRNSLKEENGAMNKQIKELQELETKLDQDTGSLKAYGSSLSAQIDTLKMVPTLFGVINF